MNVSPLAGKPIESSMLANIHRLVTAYYTNHPDPSVPEQRVAFGTSGHRGSSFKHSFNEDHILAITQAICLYRRQQQIDGPLFLGMDTHALSEPALASTLEVLAANGVDVMVDRDYGYTPTPVISHAILTYNRTKKTGLADGIVITPSHNPPEDGGFKYNPPHGGPADSHVTTWIEKQANMLLNDLRYDQVHGQVGHQSPIDPVYRLEARRARVVAEYAHPRDVVRVVDQRQDLDREDRNQGDQQQTGKDSAQQTPV